MHEGVLIVDSGPLIALSLVNEVEILNQLYSNVLVPQAVMDEIAGQGVYRQASDIFVRASWIETVKVTPSSHNLFAVFLGKGEVEVMQLGLKNTDALLLIDDYRARRAAEALHLKTTGTAGVLVRAKKMGLIDKVVPLLHTMRDGGYYIDDKIIEIVRQRASE